MFESHQGHLEITYFRYYYLDPPYDYWCIDYSIDGHPPYRIYKSAWEFREIQKDPVEAVCYLLRANLNCIPIKDDYRKNKKIG